MSSLVVRPCGCPRCRDGEPHPDRVGHQHLNLLVARLDEQQRRWFVALEAERLGRGGDTLLAQITGLNRRTIRRGQRELAAGLAERPAGRIRAPGGGRPAREAPDPGLLPTLEALLAPETAGDPMGRRAKAKRSSLRHLSAALGAAGHPASRPTVSRLLRELGLSPRSMPGAPRRAARRQNVMPSFGTLRNSANNSRRPANPSSVWIRKKGAGRQLQERRPAWRRTAEAVLVHDWPRDAIGQAIPYGVYDLTNNRGFVCIGDCFERPLCRRGGS